MIPDPTYASALLPALRLRGPQEPPAADEGLTERELSAAALVTIGMLTFLVWLLLFLLCWPLALLTLFLYPIVWLLLLPFRLVGIAVEGVFRLLAAMILCPARLLHGPHGARATN